MEHKKSDFSNRPSEDISRVLLDSRKTANIFFINRMRDGLQLYRTSRHARAARLPSIFSPVVFDRPYRHDKREEE